MPGQPPQTYVDAYWADVAEELRTTHHAPAADVPQAISEFRSHMAPAGQTIYNDDPAEIARTIVAHGLIPSVPQVGLCLQLTFVLTDPDEVLDDPHAVAATVAKLIDAVSDYELSLGGNGLTAYGMDAAPGVVQLYLKPSNAMGAMTRLKIVADAVNNPTPAGLQLNQQRNHPIRGMEFPTATVACKRAA